MDSTRARQRVDRRPASARAGVTMIDLVITVLILGILAGVASPRFAQIIVRFRVEAAAQRIVADLEYARRTAKLNGVEATIAFTSSPAGYQMTNVTHPGHPGANYSVQLAELDSSLTLDSISFDGGSTLRFNMYGLPLAGSPATALTSGSVRVIAGSEQITVSVDPSTGKASAL